MDCGECGSAGSVVNLCLTALSFRRLGELNGERGIFDSKCTVACKEDGTPLVPVNEADWVEEEAETPEERKARLERERQEKVQKLMKMMQDHDTGGGGNSNNAAAPARNEDNIDSNEGESDSG